MKQEIHYEQPARHGPNGLNGKQLRLRMTLDGQYFCTIFKVAQRYWTFVGTIERLCNVIDGIKTF